VILTALAVLLLSFVIVVVGVRETIAVAIVMTLLKAGGLLLAGAPSADGGRGPHRDPILHGVDAQGR